MDENLQQVYDEADRIVRGVFKVKEDHPYTGERPYTMTITPSGAKALVAALDRLEELERSQPV